MLVPVPAQGLVVTIGTPLAATTIEPALDRGAARAASPVGGSRVMRARSR